MMSFAQSIGMSASAQVHKKVRRKAALNQLGINVKTIVCAWLLSILSSSAFAQEQIRFRDMEWGAAPAATTGLNLVENSQGLTCYIKTHEKLQVGDATLERIRYCYYKNRLGYVMIDYKGEHNQIVLKGVLEQKFGLPYQPNQFMDDYWWHMGEEVAINMDYNDVGANGTVIYRFKPVSDAMGADQGNSNKDAAKDL